MKPTELNQVYSSMSMKRRYEVWFLKIALADGTGAWWFRYLLTDPGRPAGGGCPGTAPFQVWATWFPADGPPTSCIEGFPLDGIEISGRNEDLSIAHNENRISHDRCAGRVSAGGRNVSWDLSYRSGAGFSMSDVGWIGFSRTPHTDAVFDGWIEMDGIRQSGSPLGFGLQGHNCGFRHRNLWTWTHLYARNADGRTTTFEALEYEIGFGLYFRKALLWHNGNLHVLKGFKTYERDRDRMRWSFDCFEKSTGLAVHAEIDGGGISQHRLPYTRTDCSGTFEVANNSLARGSITIGHPDRPELTLTGDAGAVLEMVG